jgi:hypothetical protein
VVVPVLTGLARHAAHHPEPTLANSGLARPALETDQRQPQGHGSRREQTRGATNSQRLRGDQSSCAVCHAAVDASNFSEIMKHQCHALGSLGSAAPAWAPMLLAN